MVLAAAAAGAQEIVASAKGHELDRYLTDLSAYGHSFAAFVTSSEGVDLQKGYGYADIERRVPFTEHTRFFIASLTKQFIASGILVLEMQGKLRTSELRFENGASAVYFDWRQGHLFGLTDILALLAASTVPRGWWLQTGDVLGACAAPVQGN